MIKEKDERNIRINIDAEDDSFLNLITKVFWWMLRKRPKCTPHHAFVIRTKHEVG